MKKSYKVTTTRFFTGESGSIKTSSFGTNQSIESVSSLASLSSTVTFVETRNFSASLKEETTNNASMLSFPLNKTKDTKSTALTYPTTVDPVTKQIIRAPKLQPSAQLGANEKSAANSKTNFHLYSNSIVLNDQKSQKDNQYSTSKGFFYFDKN